MKSGFEAVLSNLLRPSTLTVSAGSLFRVGNSYPIDNGCLYELNFWKNSTIYLSSQ